jgi:hypothetical protein
MNKQIWSEVVKPNDWRWALAEDTCRDIARGLGEMGKFISGEGISPPWVTYRKTDRVVAYHGFAGSWVGWDRGGGVIPLKITQVIDFLKGRI